MTKPAILIGMGEMGGVFARGLLRLGTPVYPVLRSDDMAERAKQFPEPAIVLVAVAEKDLHSTLDRLPQSWREQIALLQNELLPGDWQSHDIATPTVISVWFEKKKGQDYKVLVPSPVYGPNAQLLMDALQTLSIPTFLVPDNDELLFQLVRKNVYILTTNVAGLVTGGTVDDLWSHHQTLARDVASDIIDIQEWLTRQHFDRERLIEGMVEAIHGDPQHRCMGRSAPARLANAIAHADEATLDAPTLRDIASRQSG